ncbi:FMN-binding negative transcriptional regulator [Mesorhizobium tianshanense]|uniref:FMN-binding negative transcriptional regulator n=1 Tax=Mesorhizobium tianshanense TaxID=39844 RepID=UPI001ABF3BD4
MYRPRRSVEDRPEVLLAAIREIGFATIVTPTPAGIEATHVPTIARQAPDGRLILAAHVARLAGTRGQRQSRDFSGPSHLHVAGVVSDQARDGKGRSHMALYRHTRARKLDGD